MKKCCCLSLSPALPWEGRGAERNFLEIYVVICVPEKGEVPYACAAAASALKRRAASVRVEECV